MKLEYSLCRLTVAAEIWHELVPLIFNQAGLKKTAECTVYNQGWRNHGLLLSEWYLHVSTTQIENKHSQTIVRKEIRSSRFGRPDTFEEIETH